MESQATSVAPGRRFQLQAKLGAGSFGEVLLAEMEGGGGFRRKVALKLLHPDMEQHADVARRMRDEARVLGRLAHRHIVAVLDLVRFDDRWAIVMDYVPGADLDNVLVATERHGQAVPGPAAADIGVAILRALHAASHARDDQDMPLEVVHRDIKPSNVRLTADGDVKVLDFGVARFRHDAREADTRATGWIGTELYMAPERILCEGDTPAGDVYAAGATLIELLLAEQLGRTPVREEPHSELVEIALAKVAEQLTGPPEAVQAYCGLLRDMLQATPTARPSAHEAADRLEIIGRAVEGESLSAFARRVVPAAEQLALAGHEPAAGMLVERGSSAHTLDMGAVAPSASTSTLNDRRVLVALGGAGALALVAAATGVAILAVAAWLYLRPPSPGPAEPAMSADPTPAAVPAVTAPPREIAPQPVEPLEEPVAEDQPPVPAPAADAPPKPDPTPRPSEVVPAADEPPPGPMVSRSQFSMRDASQLRVRCGDRTASGTASVRLTEFPAGTCTVQATYLGNTYEASGPVDTERAVQCRVDGEALTCSW